MCQPYRILRRSLTVPPLQDQLNYLEVKNTLSSNENTNITNKEEKDCPTQTSYSRGQESRVSFPNLIDRRKSYESLDVIDGRAMTPVNTTARQRLLKVNSDVCFPEIQIQS